MNDTEQPDAIRKARLSDVPQAGLIAGFAFGRPSRFWRLVVPAMVITVLISWARSELYISNDRQTTVIVGERRTWRALLRWIPIVAVAIACFLGVPILVAIIVWMVSGDLLSALDAGQAVNLVIGLGAILVLAVGWYFYVVDPRRARHALARRAGFGKSQTLPRGTTTEFAPYRLRGI